MFLTFDNLANGRGVAITEADPGTLEFFQEPARFLQACECQHADLQPATAERLGGMACEVMGDEYLIGWWRCRCGALVEDLLRDSLSGLHRQEAELAAPQIEERLVQARSCPDPSNARCNCAAHQAARFGFE